MPCAICERDSKRYKLCYEHRKKAKAKEVTPCRSCYQWKNDPKEFCIKCWKARQDKKGKASPAGSPLTDSPTELSQMAKSEPPVAKTTEQSKGFLQETLREARLKCKIGLRVRSKIERAIADWLFDNRIWFRYEPTLVFGNVALRPDFYIEDLSLVLEHWGGESEYYNRKRSFRENTYRKYNQRFVSTEHSDEEDIGGKLTQVLQKYFPDKRLT